MKGFFPVGIMTGEMNGRAFVAELFSGIPEVDRVACMERCIYSAYVHDDEGDEPDPHEFVSSLFDGSEPSVAAMERLIFEILFRPATEIDDGVPAREFVDRARDEHPEAYAVVMARLKTSDPAVYAWEIGRGESGTEVE